MDLLVEAVERLEKISNLEESLKDLTFREKMFSERYIEIRDMLKLPNQGEHIKLLNELNQLGIAIQNLRESIVTINNHINYIKNGY